MNTNPAFSSGKEPAASTNSVKMRKRRKPFWIGLTTLVITLLVTALYGSQYPSQAAFPGKNGLIAYSKNDDIFVIDLSSNNVVQLTNYAGLDVNPVWSAAGDWIAFESDRDGNRDIYVMSADGSNPTNLTKHPALDLHAAWSPSGTQIAFESDRDGNRQIYVINTDGNGLKKLTNASEGATEPVWSPDGTRVAFRTDSGFNVVDVDGGNLQPLGIGGVSLDWSPDSTQIVFAGYGGNKGLDIFKAQADGSNVHQLTDSSLMSEEAPVWSPDGSQIAFVGCEMEFNWDPRPPTQCDIYSIDPDGGSFIQLTDFEGVFSGRFDWQPLLNNPSIDVEKEGELVVFDGEFYAYYYIVVTNNGDVPISVNTVEDTLAGELTDTYLHVCNGPVLYPSTWCRLTYVHQIRASDLDPLVNRVDVTASATLSDGTVVEVYDSSIHQLDVFRPSVDVKKEGDLLAPWGDIVLYSFTITNDGDIPLTLENFIDDVIGDLTSLALDGGCGQLSPGVSCNFSLVENLPQNPPDPFVNTVTVTYLAYGKEDLTVTVSDTDVHELNLFQPSIMVEKAGPDLARPGDWVTYIFTVTNTSSSDTPKLHLLSAVDDKFNPSFSNCAELNPGELCTITGDYQIPIDTTEDPFDNRIEVLYNVESFRTVVRDDDQHAINLFWPSIRLEKSGPAEARVGEEIEYTITLANTSSEDTPEIRCTITDTKLGINRTVELEAGETEVIHASYVIQASDPDPLVNTASVTCTLAGFSGEYSSQATLELDVLANTPPVCSAAYPSKDLLWPADHKFVPLKIMGVSDPDGDSPSIHITSIYQDEPVDEKGDGSFTPDGKGIGKPVAQLRAERSGTGNGRVYTIAFLAQDEHGAACSGVVQVGVPHDRKKAPIDDGPLYDSTVASPRTGIVPRLKHPR